MYGSNMKQYAAEQLDFGKQLCARHRCTDELPGICNACGRQMPCDDRQRGEELVARYQHLVAVGPCRPAGSYVNAPYSTNMGRW